MYVRDYRLSENLKRKKKKREKVDDTGKTNSMLRNSLHHSVASERPSISSEYRTSIVLAFEHTRPSISLVARAEAKNWFKVTREHYETRLRQYLVLKLAEGAGSFRSSESFDQYTHICFRLPRKLLENQT